MAFGNMGSNSANGRSLRATPPRVRTSSTASTSSTPKAKTSWPGIRTPQQITIEGSKRWAVAQKVSEATAGEIPLAGGGDA